MSVNLFVDCCTWSLSEHPRTYILACFCRHICRINGKAPRFTPHCRPLESLFLNTLLFAGGDPGRLYLLQPRPSGTHGDPSHLPLSPARRQAGTRRADSASPALVLWTRWFLSAWLSPCRLWTSLHTQTHSTPCSFLPQGLPVGCLVPAGSSPPSPWSWTRL